VSPRRILVTGADGFVAGHLLPRLRAAFPDAELAACTLATLDVTSAMAVAGTIARVRPDVCVHLAAVSAVATARQDPWRAWQVNLHGTLWLAEAILREVPGCTFLFPSSAEVYGGSFRAGIALDETATLAPLNLYAATKAAADLALGALVGDGLRLIRLRPFNHTGPGQSAAFVVPAFARQLARIERRLQPPVLHVGALTPERDFLDVRDVCAAYVACLRRAETLPPGCIFNLASGTPRRIGDVLAELTALAGIDVRIETTAALLRPTEIARAAGNAAAARAALGWAPAIPWRQTLAEVLDDWRSRVLNEPPAPPGNG
jgi:GDP-4-dehydro-6-deoxy-D-mannose reductase